MWRKLLLFIHYWGPSLRKIVSKYFKLIQDVSKYLIISQTSLKYFKVFQGMFLGVFNYIVNVKWMKGWKVNICGWTLFMITLMIMLAMMLTMMLNMVVAMTLNIMLALMLGISSMTSLPLLTSFTRSGLGFAWVLTMEFFHFFYDIC